METGDHDNSTLAFLTESTMSPKDALRERIKIEFYKTYDVMTGIRIAATLGGFFSMMILLVLYKNYCKPSKTLSEEQLNAAVTAAAEEEDRALQAALEATSFYTALERRRESLEKTNQVLLSPRFSSVGGGYSHLTPPLKVMQQRGKSLPGSVMQFGSNCSPSSFRKSSKSNCFSKAEFELDSEGLEYFPCKNYLNVPSSRRVSSDTCSSADSAYLERRCSAFELGLHVPHSYDRQDREKLVEKGEEPWDFYYPIDIQVIQPTPEMSPTASERNLNEEQNGYSLQVPVFHDPVHRLSVTSFDVGLAPLASISSLGSFSSQSSSLTNKTPQVNNNPSDNQGCTCADDSLGSDSVFMDLEDDDFATESEFEYDGFDDDYSFCESKQRPVSRAEIRPPQFASFDSYDASIAQDYISEDADEEKASQATKQSRAEESCQVLSCQALSDFKRRPSLHEGNKMRKKLVKTYSEPRSSKVKRLPLWTEKGKSGYVPRRQLSSPSPKRRNFPEEYVASLKLTKLVERSLDHKPKSSQEEIKDLTKFLLSPFSQNSASESATHIPNSQKADEISTSKSIQGTHKDLPFKNTHQLSLPNAQEKRSRFQKQKNFVEDVKEMQATKEKTEEESITGTGSTVNPAKTSEVHLKQPDTLENPNQREAKNKLRKGSSQEG